MFCFKSIEGWRLLWCSRVVRLALASQSADEEPAGREDKLGSASTTVGWAADRCWPVGGEDACLTYADKSPDEASVAVLYREGCREKVLKHLSASSEEELKGSGELPPDPKAFSKGSKALPRSWLLARELLAMMLGAGAGTFDARSRAAMIEMILGCRHEKKFGHFGIPEQVIAGWESEIGGALFEALEASSILEAQKAARGNWRKSKVAMAAAGGGLVLAITGGLAAPIVAPALATGVVYVCQLSRSAALLDNVVAEDPVAILEKPEATQTCWLLVTCTAGAVALFGATGAGLTGWKMSKRWGDLEEFEFQPLETSFRRPRQRWIKRPPMARCVRTLPYLSLAVGCTLSEKDTHTSDSSLARCIGQLTEPVCAWMNGAYEVAVAQLGAVSPGGSTTVRYHFQHKVDQVQRPMAKQGKRAFRELPVHEIHDKRAQGFGDQSCTARADFRKPWMDAAKVFFPKSGVAGCERCAFVLAHVHVKGPRGPGGYMAGSGEELYSFTYSDGLRKGCHIVEQLHVDKIAGRFTWTRGLQSEGKEVASKRQGSSYVISHVSSVRFATRLGDPNSEFLSATQRQLVKHRAIRTWLSSNAPSILGLLAVLFNALTVTLVLAACLCHATWQVFPQAGDSFDMSQGPDSEALAAAATLSVLTVLAATVAGWWLGIFRCRCCGFKAFERETVGTATRLTSKIAARCKIQRPLTGAVLAVCILWCFFVLLLCPIAYGLSRRTMCDEGSCSPEPGSPLLPTCGVGRCRCGGLADLTCITASAGQDLSLCRNVKQPMCTAAGSDQTASGVHLPLLASAVGSTGVAVLLGLVWLLNAWGMYAGWVRAIDPSEVVMVPQVQYHRPGNGTLA
ncbi:unnamed protein product [Symbiodinium necroappetens]|uniref:Uncharacterized protein n=1 Tax=Symbiodinium necroappetens TaxID=1628268 RepID=A0A813CM91_9DINO|nr:unnamed protein product [Symbiodinium necroappetens]